MLFPSVASHDHYRTLRRAQLKIQAVTRSFPTRNIYSLSRKLFNPVVYYIVTHRSRQRRQIKRRDTAVKRLTQHPDVSIPLSFHSPPLLSRFNCRCRIVADYGFLPRLNAACSASVLLFRSVIRVKEVKNGVETIVSVNVHRRPFFAAS